MFFWKEGHRARMERVDVRDRRLLAKRAAREASKTAAGEGG